MAEEENPEEGGMMLDDRFLPETMIVPISMRVDKMQRPDGGLITILRFMTPFHKYSIRLDDEEDTRGLATALTGGVQIASAIDLPPGAKI